MSVTDIVRTIAKNVRETVANPGELKEKAKDLPLNVLQTAMTGVGQVLMLSDRVRSSIKRIWSEDDQAASEAKAPARPVAPAIEEIEEEEKEEKKPARREPVIFAPRPAAEETVSGPAPEAGSTAASSPVPPAAPAGPAREAVRPATTTTKPAAAEPTGTAPATTEPITAKPSALATTASEPGTAATLAEPMPGYSTLTMASLRARLRGKSADQIRELLDYERQTTGRDAIIQMYAKRLAKLEAGD